MAIIIYVFTFHYVSISTDMEDEYSDKRKKIYIPLCFYFNFVMSDRKITRILIYIPLCFYFNSYLQNPYIY